MKCQQLKLATTFNDFIVAGRAARFAPAHPVLFRHAFTYDDRWYSFQIG